MRKPETTFTSSVNKYLKGLVHFEKMNNVFRGGTPDFWYSGDKADLWIEYKFIEIIPKSQVVPNLSALQRDWLKRRYEEGRNVGVILGMKAGGVYLPGISSLKPLSSEKFIKQIITRKDLADEILAITGESHANSAPNNDYIEDNRSNL